jgi:hypothetical protein
MPDSVFKSSGGTSATQLKTAIDSSIDIEQLKQDVTAIKNGLKDTEILTKLEAVRTAIVSLVFPIATRIPQLRPAIVGTANTAIETPAIPAPGAGKHMIIQIMGWYDKTPTNGVLTITGSDNQIYTTVPITSAGAGFMQKAALPANVGATIALTAGGTGVIGSLNYAIATETTDEIATETTEV